MGGTSEVGFDGWVCLENSQRDAPLVPKTHRCHGYLAGDRAARVGGDVPSGVELRNEPRLYLYRRTSTSTSTTAGAGTD